VRENHSICTMAGDHGHRFEVYLYDSEAARMEADDPLDAVLFHHPPWLAAERVLLTAGQLAGIAHFFSATLGEEAAYFQLREGSRFEIARSGRFLLFVGDVGRGASINDDDDDITEAKLLQGEILASIAFFFGDISCWHQAYEAATIGKKKFANATTEFLSDLLASTELSFMRVLPLNVVKTEERRVCVHVARACHAHSRTTGCLVRRRGCSGEIFSSFEPEVAIRLRTLTEMSALMRVMKFNSLPFALPPGVQIARLQASSWPTAGKRSQNGLSEGQDRVSDDTSSDDDVYAANSGDSSASQEDAHSRTGVVMDNEGQHMRVRRRTKRARTAAARHRASAKRKEVDDTLDLIRRRNFESDDNVAASVKGSYIYVQSLIDLDLIVGLDGEPSSALVVDLWNIAITKLTRLTKL